MRSSYLLAASLCLMPVVPLACGGTDPAPAKVPEGAGSTTTTAMASTEATKPEPSASVVVPAPPPAPVVESVKGAEEPTPLPTVKITAPANDASVGDAAKAKDFAVKLDVKNWDLGKGSTHVHLILDDHPYKPIYDGKAPVPLSELLPKDGVLSEGQHVLHAFPSRATHESVKGKGAGTVITFWVGKKGKSTFDVKKPHLVYSRPKGDNNGDMAKNLLIDFYLDNTNLTDGHKVKMTLTGGTLTEAVMTEFTTWEPKIVKNLPSGDYECKLELVGKDGKTLEGPLTTTSRKIKVDRTAKHDPLTGVPMHDH